MAPSGPRKRSRREPSKAKRKRAPRKKHFTRPRARDQEAAAPAAVTAQQPGSALVLVTKREERLAELERWLSEGLTPRQASRLARQRWGLKRRMADAYVALVLKRAHEDDAAEPQESKRSRLRATLERAIQLAFERKQVVRINRFETREVEAPDLGAIARLAQTLAVIDGHVVRTPPAVESQVRALLEREREQYFAAIRGLLGEETFDRVRAASAELAGGRARDGEGGDRGGESAPVPA